MIQPFFTKITNYRADKYNLTTTIFSEKGIKYLKKSTTYPVARAHLATIPENAILLENSIISHGISDVSVNKIIEVSDDYIIFEYVDGVSFEKKLIQAYQQNNKPLFDHCVAEYVSLVSNSFKLQNFNDKEKGVPVEINEILKKTQSDFLPPSVSFDLSPGNIIIKPNGKYEIIDYEWSNYFQLPISFIIYRGLYYLSANYPCIEEFLNSGQYLSDLTFDQFKTIEDNIMKKIFNFNNSSPVKLEINIFAEHTELQEKLIQVENNFNHIKSSLSFRLGKKLIAPIKTVRNLLLNKTN